MTEVFEWWLVFNTVVVSLFFNFSTTAWRRAIARSLTPLRLSLEDPEVSIPPQGWFRSKPSYFSYVSKYQEQKKDLRSGNVKDKEPM